MPLSREVDTDYEFEYVDGFPLIPDGTAEDENGLHVLPIILEGNRPDGRGCEGTGKPCSGANRARTINDYKSAQEL